MVVSTFCRGHLVYYDWNKKDWFYADTHELFDDSRPCTKCGKYPTQEGYDACIGYLKDVKFACCGHGKENAYIIKEN